MEQPERAPKNSKSSFANSVSTLASVMYHTIKYQHKCVIKANINNSQDHVNAGYLMGEGFIFLTRCYGFMGGVPPPFWHVKKMYFCLWYELETLQVVRLAFLV